MKNKQTKKIKINAGKILKENIYDKIVSVNIFLKHVMNLKLCEKAVLLIAYKMQKFKMAIVIFFLVSECFSLD